MLGHLPSLLSKAQRYSYAIPAFNVTNLETLKAVIAAAHKTRSPVIIATSPSAASYAGQRTLLDMMNREAQQARGIPVVTHLDHGKQWVIVKRAIALGYRSVHMDASEQSWEVNVRLTKKAVTLGRSARVAVQGELGYLLGYEGMTKAAFSRTKIASMMTEPAAAKVFVQETGVTTLAIACGTAHGRFQGREKIDLQRVRKIASMVSVPLVLHGGSGVTVADLRGAIRAGMRIINIDTDLRLVYLQTLKKTMRSFNTKKKIDIRTSLMPAQDAVEKKAVELIKIFGSVNRA